MMFFFVPFFVGLVLTVPKPVPPSLTGAPEVREIAHVRGNISK